MRKAEKEQLLKILELLEEILRKLDTKINLQNKQVIIDTLLECQETAIGLGTRIEKREGTGCDTIRLFEEYCENIYQRYEQIVRIPEEVFLSERAEKKDDRNDSITDTVQVCCETVQIEDLQKQIKHSIEHDLPTTIETVFLPYKASMWDSLESVWKAADEDSNCETYVIPIPYFDRNSDGSFGEMHYEGDFYPKDVPITDYREFDFEEHRPDKIFIHNPYDEYNLVTSVHPDFYAKRLKTYTEELIYIPYFVLNEVDIENEEALDGMAHFCKVPAVLYADKVIVQSEQMKQAYVKILTEWQGEASRPKWEEKILGLGSPKLDKVANAKKEPFELPSEWKRIVEKTDGSYKKVIFYNTSLTAMLENSESYLDKVEDVLRVFWENREEVALLWRPHPLMEQTLISMHPELIERYLEIVGKYKKENWGIYDDSPNLHRAIQTADAYFGDASSVVQLCQKAGMPVMIQNVEIRYDIYSES